MAYDYIVESTSIESDVLILTLKPRSNHDHFPFAPGQYASIGFKRGGRPTPVRCFSIVSSPNETKLQFGLRVHGYFTRAASRLKPGDEVKVSGPFGDFTLSQDDRQVVLFAGGIGITPFMSMMRYATEARLPINITLIYSNRSMPNAPFAEEILALAVANPRLRVYFFNTGGGMATCSEPSVKCINTSVSKAHLERLAAGAYAGSTYFICGAKGFMKSMQKGLMQGGVDKSYIITESFASTSKGSGVGGFSIQTLTYGLSTAALLVMTGFIMFISLGRSTSAASKTTGVKGTGSTAAITSDDATTTTNVSTSAPPPATSSSSTTASPPSSNSPNSSSSSSTNTTYQQPVSSVS